MRVNIGRDGFERTTISDFTAVTIDYNSGAGTDASPVWTGTTIAFGGSAGANEFRWQQTGGAGGAATASASWPFIVRPASNALVTQCWAFSADATGLQCKGYPTTLSAMFSNAFRINFDALGTPASAMQLSAFQDTANTAPSPGTQANGVSTFANIVNGHATDTSSTSYLKGQVYGSGVPTGGAQETPAAASLSLAITATAGIAGAISPAAAAWITTAWQSLQGAVQFIQAPSIWKAVTAGFWYFNMALIIGPNMGTGTFVGVPINLTYTWV